MAGQTNRLLTVYVYGALFILFAGMFILLIHHFFIEDEDSIVFFCGAVGSGIGIGMLFILGLGILIYIIFESIIAKLKKNTSFKNDILDDDFTK